MIDDKLFLEVLFMQVRGETIKYASCIKKNEHKYESTLKKIVNDLEQMPTGIDTDALDTKKRELEHLREKSIQASAIRSRAQWLNDGEKPSKYFCSLEKYNYIEKNNQMY